MAIKFFFIILYIFLHFICKFSYSNNLAQPCYGCHALNENNIPNIKGLSSEYFIKSFNEYKNNKKEHYIMRIIAKGYSEQEIKSLAKYFESINED